MEFLKLKSDVLITTEDDYTVIFFKKGFKLKLEHSLDKVLDLLKVGCSDKEIKSLIGEEYTKILVKRLESIKALTYMKANEFNNTQFEKQVIFLEQYDKDPNYLQREIGEKKIIILGLGGIGGNLLQMLVSTGLKNFTLIDFDNVEINNLNRQYIYKLNSVGNSKISECERYVEDVIGSSCKIIKIDKKINRVADLDELNLDTCDLFINAADIPSDIKSISYEYCRKNNFPYITGGLHLNVGSWGPLFNDKSYLKEINYPYISGKNRGKTSSTISGSFGPTNNIIASLMANDIVKFLIGEECSCYEKTISFDFNNLNFRDMSFS